MSQVTQDIIDNMYIDMKELFIQPAKKTGIYKVFDEKPSTFIKKIGDMVGNHGIIMNVMHYVGNVCH